MILGQESELVLGKNYDPSSLDWIHPVSRLIDCQILKQREYEKYRVIP